MKILFFLLTEMSMNINTSFVHEKIPSYFLSVALDADLVRKDWVNFDTK